MLIANGVIRQAARDYSRSVRYRRLYRMHVFTKGELKQRLIEIRDIFVSSRHFHVLCNNFVTIIQQLQLDSLISMDGFDHRWINRRSIRCISGMEYYFITNI